MEFGLRDNFNKVNSQNKVKKFLQRSESVLSRVRNGERLFPSIEQVAVGEQERAISPIMVSQRHDRKQ
jgi:hypothetical protein